MPFPAAGTGLTMWLLAVLIVVALVICSMPLPKAPRHRALRGTERQEHRPTLRPTLRRGATHS